MELNAFKDEILKLAFNNESKQEEIENLLYDFYLHKPVPLSQMNYKYLARCRYNNEGEVFSAVSQLSYNPDINNIELQRCNYKNQQVFYGALPANSEKASTSSTAIFEVCMEYIKEDDKSVCRQTKVH